MQKRQKNEDEERDREGQEVYKELCIRIRVMCKYSYTKKFEST